MRERLVELSREVRHVFLIAVVEVAGGSNGKLSLRDINAPLEGDLGSLRGLLGVGVDDNDDPNFEKKECGRGDKHT